MSELVIRPCHEQDLRALEWSPSSRCDRATIEWTYGRSQMHQMAMLVAQVEADLIGQIWIDFARRVGIAVLWALRVRDDWRSRGIGTLLIVAAEREARRAGMHTTELAVELINPRARALYGGLGYELVCREAAIDARTGAALGFELDVLRRPLPGARTSQAKPDASSP